MCQCMLENIRIKLEINLFGLHCKKSISLIENLISTLIKTKQYSGFQTVVDVLTTLLFDTNIVDTFVDLKLVVPLELCSRL